MPLSEEARHHQYMRRETTRLARLALENRFEQRYGKLEEGLRDDMANIFTSSEDQAKRSYRLSRRRSQTHGNPFCRSPDADIQARAINGTSPNSNLMMSTNLSRRSSTASSNDTPSSVRRTQYLAQRAPANSNSRQDAMQHQALSRKQQTNTFRRHSTSNQHNRPLAKIPEEPADPKSSLQNRNEPQGLSDNPLTAVRSMENVEMWSGPPPQRPKSTIPMLGRPLLEQTTSSQGFQQLPISPSNRWTQLERAHRSSGTTFHAPIVPQDNTSPVSNAPSCPPSAPYQAPSAAPTNGSGLVQAPIVPQDNTSPISNAPSRPPSAPFQAPSAAPTNGPGLVQAPSPRRNSFAGFSSTNNSYQALPQSPTNNSNLSSYQDQNSEHSSALKYLDSLLSQASWRAEKRFQYPYEHFQSMDATISAKPNQSVQGAFGQNMGRDYWGRRNS
jgi:hypothetical protein